MALPSNRKSAIINQQSAIQSHAHRGLAKRVFQRRQDTQQAFAITALLFRPQRVVAAERAVVGTAPGEHEERRVDVRVNEKDFHFKIRLIFSVSVVPAFE